MDRRRKVQSVEVGMSILIALARLGPSVPLSHLAQATDMAQSKAHRYMKALVSSGLAAQDQVNGAYRLGPEALAIGFAAISGLDAVTACGETLIALRDEVNETCMLSVWADGGATVVRLEAASRLIVVNTRLGSKMPLLTTATGLLFAAFLDEHETGDMLSKERRELEALERLDLIEGAERSIIEARRSGFASVRSTLTLGISALSAPIFGMRGEIAAAFTVMGATNDFNDSLDGPIATALMASAVSASRLLGYSREQFPFEAVGDASKKMTGPQKFRSSSSAISLV